MISIAMAYINRKKLLLNTLSSIAKTVVPYKDFEIIIVDDGSNSDNILNEKDLSIYPYKIKYYYISPSIKNWSNSCIAYNIAFLKSSNETIIIQNPECYHNGDILNYVNNNIYNNNYLSFACYSLTEKKTQALLDNKEIVTLDISATRDGDDAWYNHKDLRPVGYHFCSAITKANLYALNGFDLDYANGIAYDDDEFLERVKRFGLSVEIVNNPFVYHQFHYKTPNLLDIPSKINRNNFLFYHLIHNQKDIIRVNKTEEFISIKDRKIGLQMLYGE